jgi:hypothetical protein
MRIRFQTIAAFLALCSGIARAQDPQIPRELALALIPYGGTDGGEIIVGQLPPDIAATFDVPPGARVLGSFVSLTYAQVVMTIAARADSALSFAKRSLTEHGWTPRMPPRPPMGGLQYGSRPTTTPSTFCRSGSPDAMTVSAQFHGPVTLLRLTRNTGSSICDPTVTTRITTGSGPLVSAERLESIDARMAQMPLASVPPLYAPSDFRLSQTCRANGMPMGLESQEQPLKTEMSPSDVLAYYGKQLDSAGWKPTTPDAATVSGSWSNPQTGQQVRIDVAKNPAATGCYDVSLHVTPRRSTR